MMFPHCAPETVAGFDTPTAVFAAYARVFNGADFCKAIAFYDVEAQVDVALTAFRALVIVAGTPGPKQQEYRKSFSLFCNHYGLNYQEPSAFAGLFLSLLHDKDWQANIPNVRSLVEKDSASFYLQVMGCLYGAAPSDLAKIDPELSELQFDAEIAVAKAAWRDGKVVPVVFKQMAHGWMLSMQQH